MTLIPYPLFPGIEDVDISVFSLFETYDMLGRKPDKSIGETRYRGAGRTRCEFASILSRAIWRSYWNA